MFSFHDDPEEIFAFKYICTLPYSPIIWNRQFGAFVRYFFPRIIDMIEIRPIEFYS